MGYRQILQPVAPPLMGPLAFTVRPEPEDLTMKITKNSVVNIDFKLTNDQGELLDASAEDAHLVYLHGVAGIIPGLEKGLEGKAAGDSFSVTVTPGEGFGESNPELVQQVPLSSFPDPDQLQPGVQIQGTGADSGQTTNFVVREVTDEFVMLDSNHPLAGMTLYFEGVVHEVRAATEEEIRQGHPA